MKKTNCPNLAKNLIILLILSLVFVVLFSGSIYALSSDNINLQGKIVRNDTGHEGMNVIPGSPACVVNGPSNDTCDFRVSYYTALTGGTLLLTEDFTNVEIGQFDGVFELSLGSGTVTTTVQCRDGTCNSPSEVISEYGDLYIELQFAPDGSTLTETFTRMPLEASPYAIFSKFAEGAHDAFKLSTSVSNESLENPSAGMIYFDTGSSQLKVYNGAEWQALSAGTSSSLWTDAGTYSYLTSTTDDLVLGGSSFSTGRFIFDMDGGSGSYFDVFNNDHSNKLFTILSSGNVGIGTATPGAKLEVGGTASTITNSTGNLTISTGGGNGNILLMPNGTGNVGIGTTNPTEKLEVNGTIRVDDPATGIIADLSLTRPYYGRLNYAVTPNNGKSEVRFVSKGATSGTGQTYFVVASTEIGDTGNNLLMGVASGRTFITNALNYSTAGTLHIGGVSWAGDGVVQVSGVPTDATGKMTVMGNVGIGTTSPAQKLDVLGGIKLGTTSNINNVLDTQAQSGAPSGNIYWGNSPLLTSANLGSFGVTSISNSDGTLTISPTVGNVIASLNLSHANIWTGAQTFSANTYFPGSGIWNTSGNVGIGTTSPTVALDVAGDIKASGVIRNVTVSGVTSTAASTAAKVVNIPNYTLTTGDLLSITFTNGNSVSNPTLNVNSTGAKNIRVGNTNATTTTMTISAGATLILYYDGTYFQMMGSQRTSDSDLYDRTYWGNAITAGTTIYSYKLLMQSTDGKWYPLTLESGTGTTKTVSTQPFVMNSPILYYATTTTVSPNATFSNVYSEIPTTYLNYTANQGTWTSQLPIYLKGIINSSGNFVLDNTSYISFLTQSLPTSEDGFVYILLGQMYSTTGIRLFQYHPVYEYKNGRVQQYNPSHTHNWGSILNASGVYMDYRPNNTACGLNQVLKYDSTNSKWVCADDNAGTGDNWGSQVVITNSTLTGNGTSGSPLGIALNNANTWTGMQTFRGLTVDSATATDDRILTSITTGGSTRYDGTLTNADLTAARTWTLPNKSGTIAMTSDIPVSDNYQYWVLQANGVAGSNITSTSAVSFNGSGIVTTSRSGNTITITGTEADTLQSVTNRGATTTVSSSFTGGATIRGLIVDNATATHDRILTTVASVGTARYDGTLTNADLTAARTWTLPNNSGTIALTSDIPAGHDPVTLSGENYLSLNVQQITANKINLTSNVTGTLPIGSGGTNSTTYTSNQFLWYNGTSIVASGYNQSSFASSSHSHNWSQITNGSGIYMDYRPGNTACGSNQVLKYDAVNSRWICADDTVGTGDNWGSQVVITNSTLTGNGTSGSPLGIALNNANTWTGAQTFGGNTYFPGSGIWNTSGNVGIGTTSPTHKLELASATTASGGIGFGTDVELYRSNTDTLSLASGDNFNLVSGNVQIGSTTILTSGRLVQAANGSVSSPAFSFSSDTNTGMYGTGSDTLSLVTNGTDRITINASGNVGIGTTSPTAYLHLKAGTGSANTAPLKFTTGTNLTTPESGAMEWDGSRLYITNTTPTRNTIAYLSDLSSFITQGYQTVQEEGSSLTQRSILNFIGSGITAVDDSTNSRTNITLDTKLNAFADLVSSAGVLTNNGSGGLSWVNLNSGDELLPVGTEGQMLYNNAGVWTAFSGMYWDDTNSRLGIGTTTPNNKIQIIDLVNFDNNKSSTYLGEVAGKFGAGGSNITAIGTRAGYIGSGDNLTAVGRDAGYNNKGTDSSLIGYQAGRNEGGVTYGNRLTAMGSRAGYNNQGNDVVALGYFAGSANTGSNSVFIGSNQGLNNTTENRLMIGNNSTISLLDGIMTSSESTSNLTINGRVGIATYSPTAYLHLKAGTATTNTAPLKFTAGTNLTTPESGAMEWDGSRLYITNSTPTRNTIAYTSDIPTSDNYQYWVLQANGAAGSNITSTSSVSFNGSGIVTTSRSGNVITITGTEADTLASVTGRGATTSTSSSFTGGATIRGLTVDNATATDDRILTSITTGGSARYDGTLTNSDLTAARTWTLPNNSGTIALTSDIPAGHNPVTLAGENYLSLSGQQITANKINLASNVTGTLPIGSGGTNSTTYTSSQFLWYNGTSIVASGYSQSSFASSSHSHDWSQITNGSGVYMNYKPNNTACASNQVLKYDTTNSRWICADDNAGTGGDNWGSQVVVTNSTLTGNGTSGSPLGIALSNANTWTGMQTFRGLTVDNATATDDRILTSITTVGSARYDGTLTNADLTAARTWTLPDATGTIALGTGTTSQLAYWTSTNTLGSLDYSGWDTNASDDVTTFLGLTDTPISYSGSGNYLVRVNSAATALEFVEASAFTDTDNYVDSVDFAPGSGVLTLGRTGTLPDLTTSLDGRYLQSLRWDEIQNPQGYLTLDHGMYSTLFTFNGITNSTAFSMTSSSLATGYILGLSTTSTALTEGGALDISASGTPSSSWTGNLARIEYNNGSSNVNGSALKVGLLGASAGSGTALNVTTSQTGVAALALRVNDDSTYTDPSPFVVDANGNVGVGVVSPTSKLVVNSEGYSTIELQYNDTPVVDIFSNVSSNIFIGLDSGSVITSGYGNVALGDNALSATTIGTSNTAIGYYALDSNVAKQGSTAIGYQAMRYADSTTTQGLSYNTAVGYQALVGSATASANTGMYNTAIGHQSMTANTSGSYNSTLGVNTLLNNSIGQYNVAIGFNTLFTNVAKNASVAIGYEAMRYADNTVTSSTSGNIAIGYQALRGSTTASSNTGNYNVAMGYQAMYENTSGYKNISIGMYAGYNNTTGNQNVAIGNEALRFNVARGNNVAVGYEAMYYASNTTSGTLSYNTALGAYALKGSSTPANNTGTYNTAIGGNSGLSMTSGSNNALLGYNAGYVLTSGSNNTLLGFNAGSNLTTGGNNIIIGASINADSATDSNQLNIGGAIKGNLSTKDISIVGNLGIGVTSPTYRLQLPNTADNAGKGQANAWVTYSDISLKENIQTITGGLDKIMALRGVTFDWKGQGVASSGFIAQEVDLVIPDLVSTDSNGIKSLDYGRFTPYLVEAIKEQQLQIQTAYNRIEQLENINENKIISITTPGWYRISKLDTNDDHSNIKINNTSVGSSQNIVLSIDSTLNNQNINIVSNLTTGEYDITKARINNESGVKYLEIYIPEVNENKISVKITESSNWIATDIVQITEEVNNAQEYALSGILFGISDKLEVEEDNVKIAGDLLSLSVNSSIGDSANRWNDIYAKGTIRIGSGTDGEGAIRFNVQTKTLEFSNNGVEWLSVGDLSSQMTISPEYAGAILFADGSDNSGIMTSDAVEESGSFKNYYEWVSNKDTPQDYDILVRITLPADFLSWKEDAIYLDFMTENSVSTDNNSVNLSLIGNSGTDVQITGGISKIAGVWERMSIKGADITQCNSAGGTCTLRISLTSSMEYFTRVGDITLNYNRSL